MIIKVTQEVLSDFREKIQNNEISSLRVEQGQDGFYYIDYDLFVSKVESAKMALRLRAVGLLQEFADVLLVDKVENFEMYYNYDEDTCIVRNAYMIASKEIDRMAKMDQVAHLLGEALSLAEDLNIADTLLSDVVEKQAKPAGKKAPAPKPVSVGRAIEKLKEVLIG